jgi:integrase
MSAYQKSLEDSSNETKLQKSRGAPGTFDRLVKEYFESSDFLRISPTSQDHYRYIIERLIREEKIGHRLVAEISREHVSRMVAKRASTPGNAHGVLQKIKILMHFAIDRGWRSDDPTLRVKGFRLGTIHTWTDEEIAAYVNAWPIGTPERTAFSLFLHTGQRVSDVARMAWTDVSAEAIWVVQTKTKAKLRIPLHPELATVLRQWPRRHVSILTSDSGGAFTAQSLGMWMAKNITKAGLPERCVPHGLRKAAARLLAEAGCSVKEIQAITGHASLSEIERYTRDAEQGRLAESAVARLARHRKNRNSQT